MTPVLAVDQLPDHLPVVEHPKIHASGVRHLVGFRPDEVAALLRGFGERVRGAPDVSTVEEVVIQPLRRIGVGRFVGGLGDRPDLAELVSLHRGHGPDRVDLVGPAGPAAGRVVSRLDRAWFGGYLFDHFGHFLLEGLARVLTPAVATSSDPVLFLSPTPEAALPPYAREIFAAIGVDPARVISCGGATAVGTLSVQQPTFEIRGYVRPDPYDRLKVPAPPAGSRPPILYLSRRGLGFVRAVSNEADLEQRLATELGARIWRPETRTISSQVDALANAELVVGCEGSAFHTLLFVAGPSRVVMFCSGIPHVNYLLCDELFDGDVVYVNAAMGEERSGSRVADWSVDVDLARAVLGAVRLL